MCSTYVTFGDDLERCELRRDACICDSIVISNREISILLEKLLNEFNPLQDIAIWLVPSDEGETHSFNVFSSSVNKETGSTLGPPYVTAGTLPAGFTLVVNHSGLFWKSTW